MRSTMCTTFLTSVFAVAMLAPGCDCSGEAAGSCRSAADCQGGRICVDMRCVRASDGGGGTDAGDPTDSGPLPDRNLPPPMDAGPCRAVSGMSTIEPVPVDIIIAIDNSGSMAAEAAEVRRNINNFAAIIAASGLDYRVVLISRPDGDRGVCVPPPLGSGAPACDSGPEGRLLALHIPVASRNAPDLVLANYDMYRDFLRPEAAKVFLWITDDESGTQTADSFRAALTALMPAGMFDTVIHNSIVGYYGEAPADWSRSAAGACGSLARVGATYMRLAQCLANDNSPVPDCIPGRTARVCETDWTMIFDEIARGIVVGVPVSCDFEVPAPPMGMTIDADMVRVTYRTTGGAVAAMLDRVPNEAACTANGWYFDDAMTPTRIHLCPDVCVAVQMDPDAQMDIALGCFPILM